MINNTDAMKNDGIEAAWTLLLDRFTGATTDSEVRADAGQRLSRYFPTVPEERAQEAKERMQELSDDGLLGILDCIAMLIERDSESAAELVADMLTLSVKPIERINDLVACGYTHSVVAHQVVGYLSKE